MLEGVAQALIGALYELRSTLHQDLNPNIVGDQILFDQLPEKVEVGLARRRKADLDLLETHLDEFGEHLQFAGGIHRVDEGLVAVAQVDRAPTWRGVDDHVGPGPVGERDRDERLRICRTASVMAIGP